MKKITLSVVLTFLCQFVLAQINLTNGLYICYPLDGNATDYSGNFHNGTVYGAIPAADRFGNAGAAVSFNGSNNYIAVNNIFPDMARFTISVWVNHTKPLHPSGILSDADPTGYKDLFFNVSNDGVGIDADKTGGNINRMDLYPLINYGPAVTGQALNNAWHHIVWVCDSGTQKIYIDTVLKFTSNLSGTNKGYHNLAPSIGRLGDGVSNGGYFQYFQGSMDEFKLYSRAISFAEVKALFYPNSCSGSTCIPPTVSISGPTSVCSGSNILLTASGTATSYTWSTNAGNALTDTVSVSPSATTTYTVYASDTSACPAMSTITINVTQTPTLSVIGNTTLCDGSSVTLTGMGATTYTWNTGSISVTSQSIIASPGSSTTFTLTGANGGCVSSKTVSITVTPSPTISISGQTFICSGSPTILTGSGAATYTWSSNAGSLQTASVSVTPGSTTTYTLAGSSGGCTAATSITVSVSLTPSLTISGDPLTLCSGYLTVLNGFGANTYTWSSNAGGSNSSSVSVAPQVTTTYTLTGSNGTCSSTALITVTVSPSPTITISSATICPGGTGTLTATGANSFTWNPQPQFANANSSVVLDSPGQTTTYTVIGQALNGCKQTVTTTMVIDSCLTTQVGNLNVTQRKLSLFPNPVENYVWVEIAEFNEPVMYFLINSHGVAVAKGTFNSVQNEISVKHLASGLYTLVIVREEKLISERLIISR